MKSTILGWAYRLGYRRCLIATMALPALKPPVWPDGLRVRPFKPEDAEPLRAVGADGLDEFATRLWRGDQPWGVWDGDRLIAYGWSSRAETDFSGLWAMKPGPGEAYFYNFFTHPDYRGRGLYPLLMKSMGHALAGQGVARAWIAVVSYNHASWRGVEKAGFRMAASYQAFGRWAGRLHVIGQMPTPMIVAAASPMASARLAQS